jgi:hypothetical protein
MSFDVFVQDIPADAKGVDDIPDDFEPKPIGVRGDVLAALRKVAPELRFASPDWGTIDGDGYSIEVNLGLDDPVTSIALHLRGDERAVFLVGEILSELGVRAFAPGTESGLFEVDRTMDAFRQWDKYRDGVCGSK